MNCAVLAKFPGIEFEVLTFLGDRISETISGETEPVVVNLAGDDLDTLDAKAREVAGVLKSIPGQADVKIKSPPGAPRIVIRLRNERLTQFGFRPLEVLEAIQVACQGVVVAQTHRQNQVADVAVILAPEARRDLQSIGSLLISSTGGARLPLRELADIYSTSGRFSIQHEAVRRRQVVTCATSGRDVASFAAEARKQIAQRISLPPGTTAEVGGEATATAGARNELLLNTGVASIGILLLLSVVLGNARNLLLVLLNVPFALAGGIFAVWLGSALAHQSVSQPRLARRLCHSVWHYRRNSIMLISISNISSAHEGMTWSRGRRARSLERLMPILITALVTGLGLLPLALGSGEAGREIEGPMAIVILGGLFTSTLLNLLVLPALALKIRPLCPAGTTLNRIRSLLQSG